MKIGWYWSILVIILVLICISAASEENSIENKNATSHDVVPRSIRVFSRGPEPEDPIYKGPRVSKHLHNVIQGGTVGLEFNVKKGMGKFGPLWDRIRKFFPKYRGGKSDDDFLPVDDAVDDAVKDAELFDPVGRGLINPRLKPSDKEDMEWERV